MRWAILTSFLFLVSCPGWSSDGVSISEAAGPDLTVTEADRLIQDWLEGSTSARQTLLLANRRDHPWLEDLMWEGVLSAARSTEFTEDHVRTLLWKFGASRGAKILELGRQARTEAWPSADAFRIAFSRLTDDSPSVVGGIGQRAPETDEVNPAPPDASGERQIFALMMALRRDPLAWVDAKLVVDRIPTKQWQALVGMVFESLRYPGDAFPGRTDLAEHSGKVVLPTDLFVEERILCQIGNWEPELIREYMRQTGERTDWSSILGIRALWPVPLRRRMYPLCLDVVLGDVPVADDEVVGRAVSAITGLPSRGVVRSPREFEAWALVDWVEWQKREPQVVEIHLHRIWEVLPDEVRGDAPFDDPQQLRTVLDHDYAYDPESRRFVLNGARDPR